MLKIILADNQAIFRAGAAKVLAVEDDLRVVAQAENPDKLNHALDTLRAGVLVFSESLSMDVAKLTDTAKKQKTRLVMVAEGPDDPSRFLKLGVNGVLFRHVSGPTLVECVRRVAKGENYVQDSVEIGRASCRERV